MITWTMRTTTAPLVLQWRVATMLRVRVSGLAMDQATHNPVVLLEAPDEEGVLPIWIGHPEATAIASQLAGHTFERPLTHDLLRIVIEGFEARVKKVLITELRGNTFFAKIHLSRGDEIFAIDARPSDCLVLATKNNVDIFVSEEVFSQVQDVSKMTADVEENLVGTAMGEIEFELRQENEPRSVGEDEDELDIDEDFLGEDDEDDGSEELGGFKP